MGALERPDESRMVDAVVAVVTRRLADHGGEEAARVEVVWSDAAEMFFVEVTPYRSGAVNVSVAIDLDELLLQFGGTQCELWVTKRGLAPLEALDESLEAIFAGRVEESGWGRGRYARLVLRDGSSATMGAAHCLPTPWKWKRRTTYVAYSSGRVG